MGAWGEASAKATQCSSSCRISAGISPAWIFSKSVMRQGGLFDGFPQSIKDCPGGTV